MDSFTALIARQPHRRLRPLRPRPGRQQGRRAAPRRRAPRPGRRDAPRPGALRPGAARRPRPAGDGVGMTGPRCPWRPAALRAAQRRSTTSRCSTSTASSTSGPTRCPACPRRSPRPATPGCALGFVTNNAARTPEEVAAHLTELGVPAEPADVITSSQAAATVVAELLGPGARVLPVGGPGVAAALAGRRAHRRRAGRGRAGRRRPGLRPGGRLGASSPRRSSPSATAPGTSPPTPTRRSPRRAARCPATARWSGVVSAVTGQAAAGHRQARPGDARRVRPPHGRAASARGRRPARHRHRGRPAGRSGQPARVHRGHRSGARCSPPVPTTGPTCSPHDAAGLLRAAPRR